MEILFEGAPVYTLDERNTLAEAMVVEGGRVKALGGRKELSAAHPAARRVALEGGAVIPAFNDSHAHVLSLGVSLGRADLRMCGGVAQVVEVLRQWGEAHPQSLWLLGRAYDQNRLVEGRHVNRRDLDAAFPGRPVYLRHVSGHAAVVSTAALELAKIGPDTPDPGDGKIVRDDSGRPIGLLLERATRLVEEVMPRPTLAEMTADIRRACDYFSGLGILAATDAGTGNRAPLLEEWQAYARAMTEDPSVRLTLMPAVDGAAAAGWLEDKGKVVPPAAHPNLRMGAIKILGDGALTSRTAALDQPFQDYGGLGMLIYPPEQLKDYIVRAHLGGWQVAVHAIGDRTIRLSLEGFAQALKLKPREDCRHRLEHCMVLTPALIDWMAELKVIAAAQPEFIYAIGHAYRMGLGQRAEKLMPYRTWLARGIPMCFGSDAPVTPGDPIVGWRAAVTRQCRDGGDLGPEEAVDPLTALRGFTTGGAFAQFDQEIGTLSPGKKADFVVLSHRPEKIAQEDLKVLAVSAGMLKGLA